MDMLDKIHNPITNKWVNISGKTGKKSVHSGVSSKRVGGVANTTHKMDCKKAN